MAKFKLKPCPFCGGEAVLVNINVSGINDVPNPFEIHCKNCKSCSDWFTTEQKAVSAWNRRTNNERNIIQR
ncbi:MAG: Lar family restriction alleviation protein [Clostridia bacterium]|nr:Lar family restriction alleviation protein [Clostridia bacterium]